MRGLIFVELKGDREQMVTPFSQTLSQTVLKRIRSKLATLFKHFTIIIINQSMRNYNE